MEFIAYGVWSLWHLCSTTQGQFSGGVCVCLCWSNLSLFTPALKAVSGVSVLLFINICIVVVQGKGVHGLLDLLFSWLGRCFGLQKCPWHFPWAGWWDPRCFLRTRTRLCGELDSLAKQPGDGEEQRRKRKQGNYLKKDKTFVVLKIRSHIADTTFHGGGTELFQDDEWEGQRYCLEKYGGQKRAEGPWRTADVVSICKVGSRSAACWGCGTPGKTAVSAWGGISAAVVTPGFWGAQQMSFRQGNMKRVQGHAVHGGVHHPASVGCCSLAGICREPVNSKQRHVACKGWACRLVSSLGVLFVFEQLFAGPKGWWGNIPCGYPPPGPRFIVCFKSFACQQSLLSFYYLWLVV